LSYIVFVLVFDASTLILLAKSELLDFFLEDFQGEIVLPRAVEAECTVGSWPDAALIRERIREGRLTIKQVREEKIVSRLREDFRLGRGEAEALALALDESDAIVATDDRNAIRACRVLRLGFVTAVAILVRGVEKELISVPDGRSHLMTLSAHGRYGADVILEAMKQMGG
jgi:predicted nucleic acid-binding protein